MKMTNHNRAAWMAKLLLPLISSLSGGCITNNQEANIDVVIDRILSENLKERALVRVTDVRYVRSDYNPNLKTNNVVRIIDGSVECALSKSIATKFPVGTPVRHVELVDDVTSTQKILRKMGDSDSVPLTYNHTYAFLMKSLSLMELNSHIFPDAFILRFSTGWVANSTIKNCQ